MREDNLLSLRTRRFVPATTDSQHGWRVWPNLARGLVTGNLNELWVADITYVRLREEFVYVAVVLDAHSRRVIGWALAQASGCQCGRAGVAHGAARTATCAGADSSFRPRHSVCLRRLSLAAGRSWSATEHEPRGQSLRQRQSGVLYQDAQTGAGTWQRLARSGRLARRTDDVFRNHLQPSAAAFCIELSNASRLRTTVRERGKRRGFYRDDWGEGANRPLAPDPTPRFTIFFARKLSLVSLSHVRGAVQRGVPHFFSPNSGALPLRSFPQQNIFKL